MYRSLLSAFLCITVVTSAPQTNSDITYVKIQPLDRLANQVPARSPVSPGHRESRIEILPLTISGNNSIEPRDVSSSRLNYTGSEEIENASEVNVSEEVSDENVSAEHVSEELVDATSSENFKDNGNILNETAKNLTDNNILESNRHARSQEVTDTYESEATTVEAVTEKQVEELAKKTDEYETRTRAPAPRFISKLSYFNKPYKTPSFSTNLVERPAKRHFKSKCRCEKIWNCPKLQITVPRCPNEYFLCCF